MDKKHPYLHNASYKMFADTVLMALRKRILSPEQIGDAVLFAQERYAKEQQAIIPIDDGRLHASLLGFYADSQNWMDEAVVRMKCELDSQKMVKNGTSVAKEGGERDGSDKR